MEPYKFEQDIKNKLEKRTLQPSANSWDKLEDTLQQKEHKKSSKFMWFFKVAASIVGILFVVSIFLKQNINENTPIIVDAPKLPKIDSSIQVTTEEVASEDAVSKSDKTIITSVNSVSTLSKKAIDKPVKTYKDISIASSKQLSNSESKIGEVEDTKEISNVSIIAFEEQNIDTLFLKIQELHTNNKETTISEVDALLFNAQQELALERIVENSTKTVDAYKLLQDVEEDLNKSLRVKVLETLKLNYENMKTVIAQRNN